MHRSRTRPDRTEDRIRGRGWTEDRTGLIKTVPSRSAGQQCDTVCPCPMARPCRLFFHNFFFVVIRTEFPTFRRGQQCGTVCPCRMARLCRLLSQKKNSAQIWSIGPIHRTDRSDPQDRPVQDRTRPKTEFDKSPDRRGLVRAGPRSGPVRSWTENCTPLLMGDQWGKKLPL